MDCGSKVAVMTRMFAVLLLSALISITSADVLRHCSSEGRCKNGGRCFLSAARLPSDRCLDPNAHFSDSDLQCAVGFDREAASFEEAERRCSEASGRLLWPTSAQKAEWIQRTFPAEVETGVWIGAKLDTNGSPRWHPSDGPAEELWELDHASNARTDDANCLVLQSTNGSLAVTPRSCNEERVFVCERAADRFPGSDEWIVQCACPNGWAGRYCEIQKSEEVAFDRANCAEDELNVRCEEESGTIVVDYALYGTSSELKGAACSSKHSASPTDCIDAGSLLTLVNRCQGRKSCRVERIADLFSSTNCTGGGMVLHHRMRCTRTKEETCPDGTTLVNERCLGTSAAKEKRPYAEAKRECAARGGQLASFSNRTDFVRFLNSKPPSNYEFWIHNTTVGGLPLGGPRRAECLAVSSWSSRLSQVPCFAQLGWICEFVPNGRSEARITDVPRNTSRAEKPNSSRGPAKCERREWNGVEVPATAECQTASFGCPRGLDGAAVWACECGRAEWAPRPDLSGCTSPSLKEVRGMIARKEEPLNVMRRFQSDLRELFAAHSLAGGDILLFVESGEGLLARVTHMLDDQTKRPEWKREYSEEFAQLIGNVSDPLLGARAEGAWAEMPDGVRIDRAARLMTLLQNTLVIRGTGMQPSTQARMQGSNFEGQVVSKLAIHLNDDQMMINRMRIASTSIHRPPPPPAEEIGFDLGASTMQLPSGDFLGSLMPHFPTARMFLTPTKGSSTFRFTEENPTVKIGYFTFTNSLAQLMSNSSSKSRVNSQILGAFVNDPVISVNLPTGAAANFTFEHVITDGVSNATCVYWQVQENRWSTDGCTLVETNRERTRCSCTHLTSFAILMDFSDSLQLYGDLGAPKSGTAVALDLITEVGCTISIICLLICVLVFTVFRSLHPNIRVVIHRNLCLCLLCGELLFVLGIDRVESPVVCRFVAIGLHYFFTAAFCWMLIEGYQLYLMLIRVFEASRSRTAYFYAFGFVLPAVIVCLSVLFAAEDYGTEAYCWIDVQSTTIWVFLIPIAAILLFNTGTLFVALRTVLSVQNRDRSLAVRVAGWLKGSFMLLCLLGTTWVLGFLTAVQVLQPFAAFLFTIFNSLQGLFILLLHVCCNEKARQAIRRCFRNGVCCIPPLSDSSHQSSSYGHSNFFALNKVLHWLPLRPRSSGSSGGSQKNSREHEVRFKPVAVVQVASADEDDPSRSQEEKQEDEQVIRNRLLAASPQPGVTIERF